MREMDIFFRFLLFLNFFRTFSSYFRCSAKHSPIFFSQKKLGERGASRNIQRKTWTALFIFHSSCLFFSIFSASLLSFLLEIRPIWPYERTNERIRGRGSPSVAAFPRARTGGTQTPSYLWGRDRPEHTSTRLQHGSVHQQTARPPATCCKDKLSKDRQKSYSNFDDNIAVMRIFFVDSKKC